MSHTTTYACLCRMHQQTKPCKANNGDIKDMRNTFTFANVIGILIDNKKNTYPQYLLIRDLFDLDLGDEYTEGESFSVTDSNSIRISNWCTGKRPIPADIVRENESDQYAGMEERIRQSILPNMLNISNARTRLEQLLRENEPAIGKSMVQDIQSIEDTALFFTSMIRYAISNNHAPGELYSPALSDTLLNCHSPSVSPYFVGRVAEVRNVSKLLQENTCLFLTGIAGIGKSEFVKYFAEKQKKKYTNIIYWYYSGDLKRNVTDMEFSGDTLEMSEEELFQTHYRKLKQLRGDSLLIIDNFNVLPKEDPFLLKLIRLDLHVLITTRCRPSGFPILELKELDAVKELLPLFGKLCPYEESASNTIRRIIDTVHSHTLTVCLSALSLSAGGMEPEELLYELESCGIDIASGEEIELYKDGEFTDGRMIEHLRRLLTLSHLSEEQQDILCNLSLLPVSGVRKNMFGQWIGLANLSDLNRLIQYGFVTEDTTNKTISLHPLIQEITADEMMPSVTNCRTLMDHLHLLCLAHGLESGRPLHNIHAMQSVVNRVAVDDASYYLLFLQDLFPYLEKYMATNLLANLVERMEYIMNEYNIATPCDRALLLDYKAELFVQEGKYENALKKRKRAIEILEKEHTPDADIRTASLLSNLYNNLSNVYLCLNKGKESAEALKNAFLIRSEYVNLGLLQDHNLLQQMMNLTYMLTSPGGSVFSFAICCLVQAQASHCSFFHTS